MTILPTVWVAGEIFANVLKVAFCNLRTFGTFVCLGAFWLCKFNLLGVEWSYNKTWHDEQGERALRSKEFRNVGLEFSGIEIVDIWRFMHSFAHRNVCRKSVKIPPVKIFVEAVVSFVEKEV